MSLHSIHHLPTTIEVPIHHHFFDGNTMKRPLLDATLSDICCYATLLHHQLNKKKQHIADIEEVIELFRNSKIQGDIPFSEVLHRIA